MGRGLEDDRGMFRLNDVLPVKARKVSEDELPYKRSRVFTGFGIKTSDALPPDESLHPGLWQMLVAISNKLDLIMGRLHLDGEQFSHEENRSVNLSESGMRFEMDEKLESGDIVEIRMVLPVYPAVGILTYGSVVRVEASANGKYDVAVQFLDMDIDAKVRNEIVKYLLIRQREIRSGKKN
ncbi:MAG TPA: PilZ domain-containing protein [Thermodesulfovibrionales bacterium]|nr:PilZ domain-containing protein [Thermodesulfovibrionales bacterium]